MNYLYILTFLSLFSCGQSINLNNVDVPTVTAEEFIQIDAVAEKYSYSFSEKDCSTEQEATSLELICDYLVDDELNDNCAKEERESLYVNECTD